VSRDNSGEAKFRARALTRTRSLNVITHARDRRGTRCSSDAPSMRIAETDIRVSIHACSLNGKLGITLVGRSWPFLATLMVSDRFYGFSRKRAYGGRVVRRSSITVTLRCLSRLIYVRIINCLDQSRSSRRVVLETSEARYDETLR